MAVSTSYARFELYLKQLAKVPLDTKDLNEMIEENMWPKQIFPNKFKIFIYTVEQLSDRNATRQLQFGEDLQHFLRLETPFPDFESLHKITNKNTVTYPEYMNICDSEYDDLRHGLMERGKKTSEWIGNKFIESEDVEVSNVGHFKDMLSTWGQDPCQ